MGLKRKEKVKSLTCAVSGRRSRDFAKSRQSHGLGDIQSNTQRSTALISLTQAPSVGFQHSFQARTTSSFRLRHFTPAGYEGQTVGHVQDEGGAIHGGRGRGRSRRRVVVVGGINGHPDRYNGS